MATNYQTATGSANLLGALLSPVDNWAARSAARQEGLQLTAYDAQLQEQDLLKEQQAAAQAEQFAKTIKELPFLGRDQQKLQQFVKGEEQQLYKRLQDPVYNGNFRKFWAAEGPAFMSGAATRLKQSSFYSQALQNLQNVTIGQESHAKGENLVGTVTPNGYQTGEQQLQDFLSGKSDTYIHNGSYTPDDDFKEIRSTYATGRMPWERVAMSENDKLNYLIDTYGEAMGRDKYARQHQGTAVYYRTDPITKMFDFQNDQARMKMDIGRYGMAQNADRRAATQLGLSISADKRASVNSAMQRELLGLRIQKAKGEVSGGGGKPFDYDLLSHPSEVIRLAHDPANPKKLNNGIDLSKLNSLAGVTLFGENDEVLAQQLGLQKTKYGYTRGNIKSGFTTGNGVHALDLSQSGFTVQSISPTVYYNPADVRPNGLNRNGVNGYAQVTVQFDNDQAATKAGLYNERWGWLPDGSTKAGTGVYTPNNDKNQATSRTATIFVPVGNIDGNKNKPFVKAIQKNTMGIPAANKAQSDADYPYLDVIF